MIEQTPQQQQQRQQKQQENRHACVKPAIKYMMGIDFIISK